MHTVADRWVPGERIVLVEVYDGELWSARPMNVVEDTPNRIVLWKPVGTVFQLPWPPAGFPREPRNERIAGCMERGDWLFEPSEWPASTLWFLWPDRWFSIWCSWRPDGSRWGFYVNFQRPYVRTARGLRTMDLALDITVDRDLRWHWKDADEYHYLVSRGLIPETEADAISHDARLAAAAISDRDSPFDGSWNTWRPPTEWGVPKLPKDWKQL